MRRIIPAGPFQTWSGELDCHGSKDASRVRRQAHNDGATVETAHGAVSSAYRGVE
jgi:hypothetical protein